MDVATPDQPSEAAPPATMREASHTPGRNGEINGDIQKSPDVQMAETSPSPTAQLEETTNASQTHPPARDEIRVERHKGWVKPSEPEIMIPRFKRLPERTVERKGSSALKRFPSPDRDHSLGVSRFDRDVSLLADDIHQSCAEAVRRIVRDNWEKCITGSEFHSAFLLNASLHHASPPVTCRAVRDFGGNMVFHAKHEIARHLTQQDIDAIGDALIAKASDQFLDMVLEHRLKTIDARSLINALARAERLGYENSDIIEDNRERAAPIMSTAPPPPPIPTQPPPPPVSVQSQAQSQPPRAPAPAPAPPASPAQQSLQCRLCWRRFERPKSYEYHVQKQLCSKQPPNPEGYPFQCEHCGAGFITKVGQNYHQSNEVCGGHETVPATPRPAEQSAVQPGSQITPQSSFPQNQSIATPSRNYTHSDLPPGSVENSVSKAAAHNAPGPDEAYSHLTDAKKAELFEELRQAEISYAPRFREAEEIADPNERKLKLSGIQNSFSTKQSIIRKKYGVRLRNRRTRAEIEEERGRMGLEKRPISPGGNNYLTNTPAVKRQRIDDHPSPSQPQLVSAWQTINSTQPPPPTPEVKPGNHMSVSEMNSSGLSGASATAALVDPTMPAQLQPQPQPQPKPESRPPSTTPISTLVPTPQIQISQTVLNQTQTQNQPLPSPSQTSLSSLQRKGYRMSSHVSNGGNGNSNGNQTRTPTPASGVGGVGGRQGSASEPVVLDDDDSSSSENDTDSDSDIPATVPPKKPVAS
ncbi:hypothetical protein F5Y16DRAFT_347201 [Xylariaceae sp. FL0255]|nr:hypothetical protein F5Y16DRAFT_347201 [Xylariaceae sp. FL0255]